MHSPETLSKQFVEGSNHLAQGTTINTIITQSDGKILIGGGFTTVNGTTSEFRRIARLNSDFTLDTSFTITPNLGLFAMALQSDGRILI